MGEPWLEAAAPLSLGSCPARRGGASETLSVLQSPWAGARGLGGGPLVPPSDWCCCSASLPRPDSWFPVSGKPANWSLLAYPGTPRPGANSFPHRHGHSKLAPSSMVLPAWIHFLLWLLRAELPRQAGLGGREGSSRAGLHNTLKSELESRSCRFGLTAFENRCPLSRGQARPSPGRAAPAVGGRALSPGPSSWAGLPACHTLFRRVCCVADTSRPASWSPPIWEAVAKFIYLISSVVYREWQ